MNVTFSCPHCEQAARVSLDPPGEASGSTPASQPPATSHQPSISLTCPHCQATIKSPADALQGRTLSCCLVCSSRELYVRKDFPQQVGLGLIVGGFVAASFAWFWHHSVLTYTILIGTAVIDALLYLVTGNALHCYRCHSEYRGLEGLDDFDPFRLEVHERHRQQAARLGAARRET